MPVYEKVFTYEMEGLSYTVSLYEENGTIRADITVIEGAMDVNAVYFGDDDFSGESAMLAGPLNMNGVRLYDGEVQWDDAARLSDPGLGPDGADKETYISAGDTLTIELDVASIDDVDVFGIRATSTTTDDGSIKAVSDDPEEPEDPEDPVFDKVGFGVEIGANGGIENGVFVFEDDLPEDEEGTFENYVNFYVDTYGADPEYALSEVESVIFYELVPGIDESGNPIEIPQELFRIDAPDGGFQSPEELIAAYDEAIANGALDDASTGDDGGLELIAALSLGETEAETETPPEPDLLLEDELVAI
ncbi:hypothetical protein RXV86_13855 [Alisedimentitalea sp. MJ-SS2]|uniref:hypothetical protein n=1 Tax=Aliisedimentitalea sp. MJ-SS2 TaxID=3049795 RepID=UPI002908621F|nr:hypothetical protein [Alisedimentitalea sp. MJ-SS2]MDU8928470.1 hypothetical protein [Alisedimentitalea sp. MJ-SS2]